MTEQAENNPQPTGGDESSVIKELRKQLAKASDRVKELEGRERVRAFTDAGISEQGRKAMDRLYDGDDLTPEAVRSFATDHGIAVEAESTETPPEGGGQQPDVSPEEQARRAAQDRISQVAAVGNPPPPQDPLSELNQKIEQATADGDMTTVLRLNSEKAQRLRTAAGV